MEYEFTLKYRLADDQAPETLVERLYAAGCDDAVVGVGQPGRLALAFAREADNAQAALQSALDAVREVLPQAQLIEASPDLVGLTDVAQRMGVTRQNMRKLMLTHYRSFPAPVHDGGTALWHLADVLAWMQARGGYPVESPVLELASAAMRINISTAYARLAH